MAKTCSANYVDRLLMKMNNAICPIWNSLFYIVDEIPSPECFMFCINALINETPRLSSIWFKRKKCWNVIDADVYQRAQVLQYDEFLQNKEEWTRAQIKAPINLEKELPFRICVGRIDYQGKPAWMIGFQIHHAAADGRSIVFLVARFWDLLNHFLTQDPLTLSPLAAPQMTDKKFIQHCMKYKKIFSYLWKAQYRQLSKRASALPHQGNTIGDPYLSAIAISLPKTKYHPSELFYGAILAAICSLEFSSEPHLIRLRIPVDLRSFFGVPQNSIENGCAAVMVELPLHLIKEVYHQKPKELCALVRKELRQLFSKRIYLCNALECIFVSHLSSEKKLKQVIRDDLIATQRSSTLVITHFGDVTTYLKPPSAIKINLLNLESHTPVWGSNSFVYEGNLYLNSTCFDGIWNEVQMAQFNTAASQWLKFLLGSEGVIS